MRLGGKPAASLLELSSSPPLPGVKVLPLERHRKDGRLPDAGALRCQLT